MQKEPSISIAIASENLIEFDLLGEFHIAGNSKKFSGSLAAVLENDKIKIKRNNEILLFWEEIIFEPSDIDITSFVIRDVRIGKNFHWERKEKQRFHGILKFIVEGDKITVINILPIEDYLESVISSEMNPNSPFEFLKAHAVISRSWVLAQIIKKNNIAEHNHPDISQTDNEHIKWYDREDHDNYDFCADDHCQRYQGVTKIINDKVLEAVEGTRGLVLKHDNEICDARFSKCCGGISESFENVWEPVNHPYLVSISDYKYEQDIFDLDLKKENASKKWIKSFPQAFCNSNDSSLLASLLPNYDLETKNFYRWTVEYKQEEMSQLINGKSEFDFGQIIDLIPVERGNSGRIYKLKIVGTKRTMIVGKELEIRKLLSKSHLFSSAFIVEKIDIENDIPGTFILYGAGWGHGVGLCQIGAAVMSSNGYRFDEILSHYYRNSTIQKIY